MEMILTPNDWSCLLASFAMVTDSKLSEMYEFLGHDGSEKVWPHLEEPFCYRSFCLDEMFDYCISQIQYPVLINACAAYGPEQATMLYDPYGDDSSVRISSYLSSKRAVVLGLNDKGNRHAVAWCPVEKKVFDPKGYKSKLEEYSIHSIVLIF